ncbi:hypothetical protein EOM86_05190 [Candidatus Nomurabacteria bacterium]|nr:hypothetical protein [Candidatus Nomurabacteria bacterium]
MTRIETTFGSGLIRLALLVLFLSVSLAIHSPRVIQKFPAREPVAYNRQQVRVTVYHAVAEQCWGNPLITADGSEIIVDSIWDMRWCALSRDLLTRWGGNINYGDTIWIHSEDPDINGWWVAHDCMNARYTNYVDLLVPVATLRGVWDATLIYQAPE